jgi:hypothetical protein
LSSIKAKTMSDWDRFFRIVQERDPSYYLYYFDVNAPAEYALKLAAGARYRAEIIDPWAMTINSVYLIDSLGLRTDVCA